MTQFLFCLFVLFLSGLNTANSATCPDGFRAHGTSCYLFSHETATWADAFLTCQMFDSDLVEIEDATENNYLKSVVTTLGGDGWLIGATDKAVDGEYVWMIGRTKLSQAFNNWVPGSMDNHNTDEACLGLWKFVNYSWADVSCEMKWRYICELKQSPGALVG